MKNAAHILPFLLAAALLAASCDKREEALQPVQHQVDLQLRAVWGGASRTELGPVGDGAAESAQEVRWSIGDRIAVWAFDAETDAVQLDRTLFTFAAYNADYASADFRATAAEMPVGTYTYYAFYPAEAAAGAAAGGTAFDLEIPAVQTGAYDPAADLMVATATGARLPVIGSSYPSTSEPPQLAFRHLTHLLRIEIPGGRNGLGREIKRLEITFPREVAGRVAFDAAHPEAAALAGGTRTVTLDFPDDKLLTESTPEAPRYAWVCIWPGVLEGEIAFRAYDTAGVPSGAVTAAVSKEAAAQRITPVRLTVPPSPFSGITYIELDPTVNFLGEELTSLTLSGQTFFKPFTTETTETLTVAPTAAGSFRFAVCKPAAEIAGTELGVTYTSEHAALPGYRFALPASLAASEDFHTFRIGVPYLFFEDFESVTDGEHYYSDIFNQSGNTMDHVGLAGWTGARWQTTANTSLAVSAYIGSTFWGTSTNVRFGRVDSAPLPIRFPQTTISVSYDISGQTEASNAENSCYFGTTTTSGVIDGTEQRTLSLPDTQIANFVINNNGSATHITEHKTHPAISDCSPATRLTWCCNATNINGTVTSKSFHIFLDNIKVSVGSEVKNGQLNYRNYFGADKAILAQ